MEGGIGGTCPCCDAVVGAGQGSCSRCEFPLAAYRALEVAPCLNPDQQSVVRPAIEFQNAGAVIRLAERGGVIVGRDDQPFDGFDVQTFRHRELQQRHVAFLSGQSDSVWLVDLCPDQRGVFIDGRLTPLSQLVDGAVVQIGPLGWKFSQAKGILTPVTPIAGFDLAVDAEVDGRLTPTKLHLCRGEMTALVGPSGCGKSTLLETIRDGSGLAGEIDTAGRVFFVPQRDLVHHDLKLRDALLAIAGLYGRQPLPFEIDAALDSVGLPASAKDKFPGELSGGQLRRFRIAGALLSGAGVIVLDEPDSGLDHETAGEVIALLRSLAIRGATVVAVTHHRHVLDSFDRVITMRSTPDGGAVEGTGDAALSSAGQSGLPDDQDDVPSAMYRFYNRMAILFRRERQKLTSPKLSRLSLGPLRVPHLMIGLLLVPVLFAVAIAISVPTDPERDVADGLYGQMGPINRLGFLAVVSVIWMSASGSHLSITRDRELYDYERSYGVTWGQLLSAKSVVLVIAGMLQTLVFAGLLYVIRDRWLARSFFVDERAMQLPGVVLCLLGVSIAATMLGLLISAMAGRGPLLAAAILPVVMMFQILFSAPFAISDPDGYEPLADYDSLTVFSQQSDADGVQADDDDWEDEWEDDWVEEQRPLWATSLLSYTTLSRYGDKWLRSFAVTTEPPEQARTVQWRSAGALAVMSGLCFVASWFVLWIQSTRLGVRRVHAAGVIAAAVILCSPLTPTLAQSPLGQPPADAAAEASVDPASSTIRLSLVQGRYDENKLRRAMGGRADDRPRWREFGNQDRLGLVALELVGKIEFSLSDDELVIRLKQTPKWDLMKQLAPPRLIGREDVGDVDDVVVFVHGLEGGESTFAGAAEALAERGIASMRFDYPNDGPPAEIGRRLAEQLAEFDREHPDARVHLVAHSLGGLVSTWAVTESDFPARRVPHVVALGTPFRGSALASFHDELELFDVVVRLVTGTRGALNTVADGRGEAAEALQPGSEFLRQLHRRERPAGIQFHLAAGTKSFLTKSRRDRLAVALPGELARLAVSKAYAARINQLMDAEELLDGKGDGAVTVESALGLPNPTSKKTFSQTHTGLVSADGPLEWVLEVTGLAEPEKPLAK